MKAAFISLCIGLIGIVIVLAIFSPVCLSAALHRVSLPSSIGVCPPFVNLSLQELEKSFLEQVEIGAPASIIELALDELGVTYSWDRFQQRYQGIIRHTSSSFHAITFHVYVDDQGGFKDIQINDSFTTL